MEFVYFTIPPFPKLVYPMSSKNKRKWAVLHDDRTPTKLATKQAIKWQYPYSNGQWKRSYFSYFPISSPQKLYPIVLSNAFTSRRPSPIDGNTPLLIRKNRKQLSLQVSKDNRSFHILSRTKEITVIDRAFLGLTWRLRSSFKAYKTVL